MTKPLQLDSTSSHYLAHAWLCVENVGVKKLIATVFLSIAICVGSVGMSAAAESQVSPKDLCNRLAEHPSDENKKTEGVYWDEIDVDNALVACRAAAEAEPTDPKVQFQLGRVLERAGSAKEAASWYQKAVKGGYAQAYDHLTSMRVGGTDEVWVNQEKRELKWTAYRGFSDDWDTSVVAYYSITTDGQTSKAKKGAIYGCPYGDPSFDKIGNPAIGWIANLGGLCGNTFSWKSVLLIPDNDPVEFIAKEKPIWEQQSNGEVWVWSSYQEWGQTGTSESFVVPELRCIAEVEEGHEPYLCRLPSDVTTWPENFYVSSSFLGIFVAGLKQDDPALMLSALENASDKSISWVGAQGFPTSREELRALALDDASTRAVPPWIR